MRLIEGKSYLTLTRIIELKVTPILHQSSGVFTHHTCILYNSYPAGSKWLMSFAKDKNTIKFRLVLLFWIWEQGKHQTGGKQTGIPNISYLRILEEGFALLFTCVSRQTMQKCQGKQVSNIRKVFKFCKRTGDHL